MAVNPRAGEGASKGSRYIPERLVGPGVIEQNCYMDQSKSRMHTGDVVPVPNRDGLGVFIGGPGTPIGLLAGVRGLGDAVPGDIVRVVPSGLTMTSAVGTDGDATTTRPVFTAFKFQDVDDKDVGFLINFHSLSEPFYVVIPPNATKVSFDDNFGNSAAGVITGAVIAVQIFRDN